MTFKVIPFTEEHYRPYALWLEARGRMVPKYEYLPEGVVVTVDDRPTAAGFMFPFGKIASIGNLASAKEAPGRSEAVEILLNDLMERAKQGGHEMVVFSTNKKRLMERLEARGFTATDRDLVQYARAI